MAISDPEGSITLCRRLLNRVAYPFWNRQEGRLRALLRLFIAWLALMLAQMAFAYLWRMLRLSATTSLAWSLAGLPPLFVALFLAACLLDRRPLSDFGFHLGRRWMLDFAFGLALGALLMTGVFAAEWAAGWVTVTHVAVVQGSEQPFALALLGPFGLFVFVGISEEATTRGYLLTNLAEGLNLRPLGPRRALVLAWVISSVVFGWMHAENPNATPLSTLHLMLAGLWLGLGFVLTGDLAISIGLHITWNFFQGNVFGFPVSGIDLTQVTLLDIQQGGPRLWTGGAFGPEAGLLGLLAGAAGALAMMLWIRRRHGRLSLCERIALAPRRRSGLMGGSRETPAKEGR